MLRADPKRAMHEAVVSNLTALYQMREGGANSKAMLERLVVAAREGGARRESAAPF